MTIRSSFSCTNQIIPLVVLVICQLTGCSKSITSIGPFEGNWNGEIGYYITSGYETGMIQLEVSDDRSVLGYGEIWEWFIGGPESVKVYELQISGVVNPNGALECRYKLLWIHPTIDIDEIHPRGYGDFKNGTIEGYLNPAFNYGEGACLSGGEKKAWLAWLVRRQE